MTPEAESPDYPFWKYEDLALFLGSILPLFAIAALVVRICKLSAGASQTLVFQSLIYLLLLGVLYLLVAWRYQRPFWRSLRWTGGFRGSWLCIAAGPFLAIAMAVFGVVLRAPPVPSPIEDLISDRRSLVVMMLFLTVLGPVIEELTYRGFLFPLLARSLGAWPGILLTAVPFALMHGSQYHWSWQHLIVIGVAGVAFGFVRWKTGSTFAAAMVHAGYNTTLFVGFLFQRGL